MTAAAEKIDYKLIPVIDVARALLGQETRERTTANQKHFDGHGGLFVNIKKNRWYSHGNQTGGDAIDLIRFALGCDYKAAHDWLRSNGYGSFLGERSTPQQRRVVSTYDYIGELGAEPYHVDRSLPKSFSQWRTIDGERVNGVAAGLYERSRFGNRAWYRVKDEPRAPRLREFPSRRFVPYRLPELIKSGDAPVLIAGGEKDVDNLRALGFTATCNHGGEGKWWPELTPYFKDRRVFLLCDNDEQGETHQSVVGAALKALPVRSVLFDFPSCLRRVMFLIGLQLREKDGLNGKAIYRKLAERFRDEATAWEPTPCAVSAVRCQMAFRHLLALSALARGPTDLSILLTPNLAPPETAL